MRNVFCLRFILFCVAASFLAGCATSKKSRCCCGDHPAMADAMAMPMTNEPVLAVDGSWQDDDGKDFQLSELRGRPVVISMFYASCEGVCIITKDDLKAVEASLSSAVRERTAFVLVTLAPDLDTSAVLKNYRSQYGLSEKRWTLLRGSAAVTAELAARLGIQYGRDKSGLFRHSSEIVVLDETGKILLRQDGVHADLAATAKVVAAQISGSD